MIYLLLLGLYWHWVCSTHEMKPTVQTALEVNQEQTWELHIITKQAAFDLLHLFSAHLGEDRKHCWEAQENCSIERYLILVIDRNYQQLLDWLWRLQECYHNFMTKLMMSSPILQISQIAWTKNYDFEANIANVWFESFFVLLLRWVSAHSGISHRCIILVLIGCS